MTVSSFSRPDNAFGKTPWEPLVKSALGSPLLLEVTAVIRAYDLEVTTDVIYTWA